MRMIVTCGLESCFEDSDLTADDLLDVDNLTCELFASFDPSLDSILSFGVGNIYGFNGEVFPLYTDDVVYEIGQAEKIARNLNPGRAENYEVTMQNGCKLHKQMCSESEFPLSVSILECINRFGNRKIVEVLGCNRELMLQYL
ncbi:hypothetical protein [Vibrio owensii]|uniref:hypothetical protein n=1 Tax=Vibrio owensii TaxID=696485 RepID=UPI001A7EF14D|nr:hypothetical protein [Vibrio owensii]